MVKRSKVRREPAKPVAKPERARVPDERSSRSAERRSGEGSGSALARMKRVERERQWPWPEDDGDPQT
ncbi:MAG: hypothetical protein NDJ19_01040 [Ramlibacter sp.]|nr:hypothetical protein [Ramlibacter sp.]